MSVDIFGVPTVQEVAEALLAAVLLIGMTLMALELIVIMVRPAPTMVLARSVSCVDARNIGLNPDRRWSTLLPSRAPPSVFHSSGLHPRQVLQARVERT